MTLPIPIALSAYRDVPFIVRLTGVTVYAAPVVPSQELGRKLELALAEDPDAVTLAIAPREFEWIAAHALSAAG